MDTVPGNRPSVAYSVFPPSIFKATLAFLPVLSPGFAYTDLTSSELCFSASPHTALSGLLCLSAEPAWDRRILFNLVLMVTTSNWQC